MKKSIFINSLLLLVSGFSWSQYWPDNSLNNGGLGNVLGNFTNHPIDIFTWNRQIAQFTTGNSLSSLTNNFGDGLRIRNLTPFGSSGNLDMFTSFTSGQNESHIVWGGNGQISGQANRFEVLANAQGFLVQYDGKWR